MSEHDILARLNQSASDLLAPVTHASLIQDLERLGLKAGMTVLAHSSLSSLGWVLGGAQTVIEALQETLGPSGTLMMPTHSMQLTDPQHWRNPPVPESWWPIIRQQAPVFDRHLTPTRAMGVIPELFRNQPGVQRSAHPHGSFAAQGPLAQTLLADHRLDDMFGEGSPLARLYDHHGHVLLLGVDHGNNTSLHLAENRASLTSKKWLQQGARLIRNGGPTWVSFEDLSVEAEDFSNLGDSFAADTNLENRAAVGWGEGRLVRQREIVDYGRQWLEQHRN